MYKLTRMLELAHIHVTLNCTYMYAFLGWGIFVEDTFVECTFVEDTFVESNIGRMELWSNGTLVEWNFGRMEL